MVPIANGERYNRRQNKTGRFFQLPQQCHHMTYRVSYKEPFRLLTFPCPVPCLKERFIHGATRGEDLCLPLELREYNWR